MPNPLPSRDLRGRIEIVLGNWARWMIRRRDWAIALPVIVTVYAISWLPALTIDNSTESFLHPEDPTVAATVVGLAADVILAPALMLLLSRGKLVRKEPESAT